MQVSRLEIFGFKSFMERLVFPLEAGLTGLVGPNGCGKSNIVDAIRWILGETRARSLRGGTLEDVIFNGTDKLRPLGLAEVTLTLKADQEDFFADLVSPSLEADMLESELLAGVIDEAMDAGQESEQNIEESPVAEGADEEDKPHLTVIEGNLDKNPEECAFNESGEGQSGEKQETVAAQPGKGVSQTTLINKFSWLKSVSEVQITRRLYRSGESEYFINRVSCRLKDIKELFRAVGLGARAYTIVAQNEVSRIVTAKSDERRAILEGAAGVQGLREKVTAAKRRLDDTSVNVSRLEDILKEVTKQVSSLKRLAARARNRQTLKDEIYGLDTDIFKDNFLAFQEKLTEAESRFTEVSSAEEGLQSSLRAEEGREESARGELMGVDVQGDDLRLKIDTIKEELRNRAQQRSSKDGRMKELGAFMLARDTELRRLDERKKTLNQRFEEAEEQFLRLKEEESVLQEELNSVEDSNQEEIDNVRAAIQQHRTSLKEKERAIYQSRDRLMACQTSLKSLKEQLDTVSPVSQLKKTFSEDFARELSGLSSEASLLADGLTVPAGYERAVQAVLSEKAEFLVCDNPYDFAKRIAGKGQEKGKTPSLGLYKSGARLEAAGEQAVPFQSLMELLEIDERSGLAVSGLLSNVFFCENVEEAIGWFENDGQDSAAVLVTRSGEVITSWSFHFLRQETGVIQLLQRIRKSEEDLIGYEEAKQAIEQEKQDIQQQIEVAEVRQKELLEAEMIRQQKVRTLGSKLGSVQGRLQSENRTREQVQGDLDKADSQVQEALLKIEEYRTEQSRIREEIESLKPEEEHGLTEELGKLNQEYAALDSVRRQQREVLSRVSQKVSEIRRELDRTRSRVSNVTLDRQRFQMKQENLKERIVNEYGEELYTEVENSQPEARLEQELRREKEERSSKLKARIIREGDVDPESIGRLEEEKTRLDDLTRQKKDLEDAAATLKKTITTLTETSEKRFLKTFEAVRRNFSELVPRLFGGGKGDLALTDPKNPLESGLDVIARPPGKKLKSIELLSGGEKALCAVALIIALFKERPSPLCVLDEVDAPLDDSNLERLLLLLKEMSTTTQFVLITHNKISMAAADSLIGVTMQEPGASRMLSVSFQEAVTHAA